MSRSFTRSSIQNEGNLSGPVLASVTEFQGTKFIFFADNHKDMKASCNQEENYLDLDGNYHFLSNTNYDITGFLYEIFKRQQGDTVDFFLEVPYTNRDIDRQTYDISTYMYKIYYTFKSCFTKKNCSFDNVRFHSIDIRSKFNPTSKEHISTNIFIHLVKILTSLPTSIATRKINPENFQETISFLDLWMSALFLNGYDSKILEIVLTSDDYYQDLNILLRSLREKTKLISPNLADMVDNLFFESSLSTKKDDLYMSKLRAQLYALQKEGQTDLAAAIYNYGLNFQEEYGKSNEEIYNLYLKFRNLVTELMSPQLSVTKKLKLVYDISVSNEIIKKIIIASSIYVDLYTLARLFRTYDEEPSAVRIIYAGTAHIYQYHRFFEDYLSVDFRDYDNLGLTEFDYSSNKEPNRCLRINLSDFL